MAMRFGWWVVGALLVMAVGCKSKSDGEGNGDGDGDGDAGGASGDGDGDGDGDTAASIEPESGERLELRVWSGGGIEWVESVYDVELGISCNFVTATDGNVYCFPAYESWASSVQVVFTDEDCTEVVGRSWESECTQLARYTRLEEPGECYPRPSIPYEVGSEVELPETIYERDYQGNCIATEASGKGHELSEVPLEDLAAVSTEIVPRTSDLGVQMHVSQDGLRLASDAYDLNGEFVCYHQEVGPRADLVDLCVGNLAYADSMGGYGFSDDSCESLAAGSGQCREPAHIMSYSQVDGCWETELLEVGSEIEEVHTVIDDMCTEVEDPYYNAFYELGDAVGASDLPIIDVSHEGDTRLVKETYSRDGTLVYSTTSIWDTSLDAYCYPRDIGGTSYCVPNAIFEMGPEGNWFADDACTEQLQYYIESECYDTSLIMIGIRSEQDSCGRSELESLHAIEAHDEEVIYVIGPEGDCVEEPAIEDAIYIKAGDELDPSEILAEVSLND